MQVITDISLWELVRHLQQWLVNLRRAGDTRKEQSVSALRSVIVASRQTSVYIRQLRDNSSASHSEEARLAALWSNLGFQLEDLGLTRLAKRCDIKGRYWADPNQFDEAFLDKADVGLERMEQLARQMLAQL